MGGPSTSSYRFGDLLAVARQSWVRQLVVELADAGYVDYRRSDALVVRLLARGPLPVGRVGDALGVTRQAARKVAMGLERRGYATAEHDPRDGRRTNITLSARGQEYASEIARAIERLDSDIAARVLPEHLEVVDGVLRAVLVDDHSRKLAALVAPPRDPR